MKKIVKKAKNWTVDNKERLIRFGLYGVGVFAGIAINELANQRARTNAWDRLEEASDLEEDQVLVIDRDDNFYQMRIIEE